MQRVSLGATGLAVLVIGFAFVVFNHDTGRSPSAASLACQPNAERPGVPPTPTQPDTSGAVIKRHCLNEGVGDPWGTAFDDAGTLWIAEPGCDFEPRCAPETRPGQIGQIASGSDSVRFYTLPNIPGNQPAFVQPDGAGRIWFTTPNNGMIGEFDPATGKFVGQWPVTSGSGPWALTFSHSFLWYTEYFASAIGRFDPASHTFIDLQTPSPDSHPYDIVAAEQVDPDRVWFTENNPSVARIGVVDPANGNAVWEIPIRAEAPPTLTPHMIAVDHLGGVWWTEGYERVIGHLEPKEAYVGSCGTASGSCVGIREFPLPAASGACPASHISGIAIDKQAPVVWFDDSLSSQLGSVNMLTGGVTVFPLQGCSAHAHDGLNIDAEDHIWWDEEFANAVGELAR